MSKELVIVSSKNCSNCGPLKRKLDDNGIKYREVDAELDENMEYCRNYRVRGLPTALFFENDELVKSLVGNCALKEYEGWSN
jgi:thioredoxin-related protein